MNYSSDIQLGAEYRDRQTEVQGIAVVISFHQHSCERVVVETKADDSNDIKFYEFDSVRLEKIGQGFAKEPEPEKADWDTGKCAVCGEGITFRGRKWSHDSGARAHAAVNVDEEPVHEPTRPTGATQTSGVRRTGRRQS